MVLKWGKQPNKVDEQLYYFSNSLPWVCFITNVSSGGVVLKKDKASSESHLRPKSRCTLRPTHSRAPNCRRVVVLIIFIYEN
ncbi:MAG: hypothetical protein EAZ63_00435 [Runella slithyformis]|nr:MAG: hypothetical protein EAZ63_00435 [Runella slithyformis]